LVVVVVEVVMVVVIPKMAFSPSLPFLKGPYLSI
jgi:hypothetical protein